MFIYTYICTHIHIHIHIHVHIHIHIHIHIHTYIYMIYIYIHTHAHFYPFVDNLDHRNVSWRSIFIHNELNNRSFIIHPWSIIYQYRGSPLFKMPKSISRLFPRLVSRMLSIIIYHYNYQLSWSIIIIPTFQVIYIFGLPKTSSWMNSDFSDFTGWWGLAVSHPHSWPYEIPWFSLVIFIMN